MSTPPLLLAQTPSTEMPEDAASVVESVRQMFQRLDILNHPDELLDALAQLPLISATMIVIVGALCVLNGYRWHKWVVVILAFMGGVLLGRMMSEHMGKSHIVAVALGLLCAIVATPLLRIAVAVFGGLTGAFIGANAWTAVEHATRRWRVCTSLFRRIGRWPKTGATCPNAPC